MGRTKKQLAKAARMKVPEQLPPEHPWDRQIRETDKAWVAFITYRDLGPAERSCARVAKTLGKCNNVIEGWSQQWEWVARVHAYDAFVDRAKKRAELAEIVEMRKRHIQMAMSLQGAAALALNKIVAAERVVGPDGKPAALTLKPSEVKELADLGMKIERLNRGEPDSIQEQRVELEASDRRKEMRRLIEDADSAEAVALLTQKLIGN